MSLTPVPSHEGLFGACECCEGGTGLAAPAPAADRLHGACQNLPVPNPASAQSLIATRDRSAKAVVSLRPRPARACLPSAVPSAALCKSSLAHLFLGRRGPGPRVKPRFLLAAALTAERVRGRSRDAPTLMSSLPVGNYSASCGLHHPRWLPPYLLKIPSLPPESAGSPDLNALRRPAACALHLPRTQAGPSSRVAPGRSFCSATRGSQPVLCYVICRRGVRDLVNGPAAEESAKRMSRTLTLTSAPVIARRCRCGGYKK